MAENLKMKVRVMLLVAVLVQAMILTPGCSNDDNPATSSTSTSAPASHTLSKKGVMHMSGLSSPATNCSSCHGSDLRGGTAGVSCYSCHGQLW
jgi:hypothetical protein